jgi:hypothetical protein
VTTNTTYTAVYTPILRVYTATIVSNNSSYWSVSPTSVTGNYNTNISSSTNTLTIWTKTVTATPAAGTDNYSYRFVNWTSNCWSNWTKLTWDCTITANFEQITKHTVTFDANRWTIVEPQKVADGEYATQPSIEFPGYTFWGWYISGTNTQFNFNTTPITGDITLVARWTYNLTFNDLNVYFVSSTGAVNYGVIMDRNLWATATYNQNYSSPNNTSYWFYYQWWNNYWFPTTWSLANITTTQVPYDVWSKYVPSKYANGVFVRGVQWMWWATTTDNIWW